MANKDLFKQAIAEAKSVREAAIANAKEALEETLTPHLKDMLAAKLQEMEDKDIDEEVVNEEEVTEEELNEAQGNVDAHEENPADQLEEELTFEEEEEGEEEAEEDEAEEEEAEDAEEEVEVKDMEVEDLKDLIRDIIAQEVGHDEAEEELPGEEIPADDMVAVDDEEEIDLDELLRELGESSHEDEMEEEIDEVKPGYGVGTVGKNNPVVDFINKVAAKGGELGREAYAILQDAGKSAGIAMRSEAEIAEETEELNEAIKTVNSLKAQLQEVNLLNAKLLYVNKVFKANNLTESQKVNVIAAFDKAETVKEAKLVFETVSENVVGTATRSNIKESKLGMASKATGTTASKPEVISEVSDAVRRMQKLAGIIK